MNQDQPELTLEESIKQVMQTLPPVIRAYFAQGKYTVVAKGLMVKYALRVDQAGVLEREIMLLLMGIESPDEFIKALAGEAQLSQQVINGIVRDVNDQIFVPLREEERKSGMGSEPQPTPHPASYFHLENKISPPPQNNVAAIHHPPLVPPPPQNAGLRGVLSAVAPKALESEKPKLRLEDHEEPHIEFHPAAPKATPGAVPNLPGALPPVAIPRTAPPSPPIQPRPIPAGARAPFVTAPKAGPSTLPKSVPPTPAGPPAPARPYSVDPYREPIEP